MHYIITGGSGFIGSHLTKLLLKDNHHVIVIDDLSTGNLDNLSSVKDDPNLDIIIGDVLDLPELPYLVSKADVVFHLAAAVGVELVVHDPVRTIKTNVHGTERILEAASRHRVRTIIASTSEVYGKSPKDEFSESDDLLIGAPKNSRWSYACSKLLDEFFMMAFVRDKRLPGTVVRLFNTVGPGQTGQYGMVVPRFVKKALNGEPVEVYGTGEQTRCFCHVFDTIRALVALSQCDDAIGRVVNIGNTHKISINELAEEIITQLGSDSTIKHIPYEIAYEKGFEDMLHRKPNINLIQTLVGWNPKHTLEKIISDVAQFEKGE
jgi:UDP-glucose 4-epimerase